MVCLSTSEMNITHHIPKILCQFIWMTIINFTFQFYLIGYLLFILCNFVYRNIFYLMLPSIGIVFPCKYSILMGLIIILLLLLPNETVITTVLKLPFLYCWHKLWGLNLWRCNKSYAGRLKTLEDGAIDVISERNYAPNPVDKLAT